MTDYKSSTASWKCWMCYKAACHPNRVNGPLQELVQQVPSYAHAPIWCFILGFYFLHVHCKYGVRCLTSSFFLHFSVKDCLRVVSLSGARKKGRENSPTDVSFFWNLGWKREREVMRVLKCSWRQPLYTSNICSVICCLFVYCMILGDE